LPLPPRIGFAGVEFLFPYDFPAEDIKARLDANGLTQALFNARRAIGPPVSAALLHCRDARMNSSAASTLPCNTPQYWATRLCM